MASRKKTTPAAPAAMIYPGQRVLRLPDTLRDGMLVDPLTENLLLTAIGYFPHAMRHFYERPQGTSKVVLIYCVRGEGWGELKGERFPVRAGDLLLLPAGTPHAYGAAESEPWTIYWLHAEGRQIQSLTNEIVSSFGRPVAHLGGVPVILSLFDNAFDHLSTSYSRENLIAGSLCIANLLGEILCRRRTVQFHADSTSERIEGALELLRTRITGHVTVEELAGAANLSVSRFSVLFRERTGFSVKKLFTDLKMRHACHLLDTTEMSIKAIARELAFEDQLYFSRQFRHTQGLSPKEYRAVKKG